MKRSPYRIRPPLPAKGRVSLNGWWALWEQKRRRSRMSVPPFVPPGSLLWLKAASIAGVINDPIPNWPDSSGNAQDVIQSTVALQPTLQQVTFAGKTFRVARFDTADDGMGTTAAIFGSPFSVFLLWRPADLEVNAAAVCSANIDWRIGNFSAQMVCYFEGLAGQAPVNTSDFFLVESRLTPGQNPTWAFLNGVQTSNVVGGGTSSPGAVALGSSAISGLPGGCDLAELLIYNRLLSDGEAAGVRAYFQAQYNYLKL